MAHVLCIVAGADALCWATSHRLQRVVAEWTPSPIAHLYFVTVTFFSRVVCVQSLPCVVGCV